MMLMRKPCSRKMRRTCAGCTPKLIITAMSRVFSITIMVRAMRMLSAATMTMSAMTMKVTTCSSLRARKSSRFCSIQLVVMKPRAGLVLDGAADGRSAVEIVHLEADDGEQVGLAEEALRVSRGA